MANPLYEQIGSINPYSGMIKQIDEFSKNIQGNPRDIVQGLLNSGKISQAEFNNCAQLAQQILPYFTNRQ